jgi:hypothetical protein
MKERKKRFVSQPDKKKPKQANKTKQNKTKQNEWLKRQQIY